jgi:ATP-dependent DNA helicase DinG
MVVIDKLPFASPDDPILRARVEQMKKDGKDAFNQLQVPAAIIALKQGIGRLIRDVDDEGVLVIGDPRLYARQYGKKFVASLPKMVRTREQSLVVNYAKSLFEED